jgi:xanthine dehydrogenase accessory factor
MPNFYQQLLAPLATGESFALAVITGAKGSSPQKIGAKAAFFADGRILGTLGGGCLEAEIQDRARRALRSGLPETFELILDHDFGWDDGLICGGKVRGVILPGAAQSASLWRTLAVPDARREWGIKPDFSPAWVAEADTPEWRYRETVLPPCVLWVAGSGHIAQAVAPVAQQLNFELTVFDDRPTFANSQFFPSATAFRVDYWEKMLAEPFPDRPVFGLIVTRGHQRDALVLRSWIQRPFAFLGMIGSSRKKRLIFEQFMADGLATSEQLAHVACPVGLDIGAQTVPEIAVSIVAQLVQRRAELSGRGGPHANESRPAI